MGKAMFGTLFPWVLTIHKPFYFSNLLYKHLRGHMTKEGVLVESPRKYGYSLSHIDRYYRLKKVTGKSRFT